MLFVCLPVILSMKFYTKRQQSENRRGLPDRKERTLNHWTRDPGEVEEQAESRRETEQSSLKKRAVRMQGRVSV